jgi:hypothetical protein
MNESRIGWTSEAFWACLTAQSGHTDLGCGVQTGTEERAGCVEQQSEPTLACRLNTVRDMPSAQHRKHTARGLVHIWLVLKSPLL